MSATVLALLSACASTSLTSFTDPDFVGVTFQSVAVWTDADDLEWRQDLEATMQDRILATTGAQVFRMVDIAPPTRDFDTTEVFQLMRVAGADAAIVVAFADTGVSQKVSGNQYGVYTSEMPWANATVVLYEVESGAKVWTGTAKTQGDEFTDWAAVRRSVGRKIIDELLANDLLPPPSKN
jgi:hypothetical protein